MRQFVAYAAPWDPFPDDGLPRFAESRGPPGRAHFDYWAHGGRGAYQFAFTQAKGREAISASSSDE